MPNPPVVDSHHFSIWRYADDSVDIQCTRDQLDVDHYSAFMESSVLTRSLAEELHGTDEVFSVRVYSSGLVSSYYREDPGFITGWQQFRWVKERLCEASYSGLISHPMPWRRILWLGWALEYGLARLGGWLGRKGDPKVAVQTDVLEAPPPPDNVVPFPTKR